VNCEYTATKHRRAVKPPLLFEQELKEGNKTPSQKKKGQKDATPLGFEPRKTKSIRYEPAYSSRDEMGEERTRVG
jgi:hypothetical protein